MTQDIEDFIHEARTIIDQVAAADDAHDPYGDWVDEDNLVATLNHGLRLARAYAELLAAADRTTKPGGGSFGPRPQGPFIGDVIAPPLPKPLPKMRDVPLPVRPPFEPWKPWVQTVTYGPITDDRPAWVCATMGPEL